MRSVLFTFSAVMGTISWLVPNHYPPWNAFHSDVTMAGAILLAFAVQASQKRGLRCSLTPLLTLTFALIFIPLLQAVTGRIFFAGDAWMASAYLLAFALSQMLGQSLGESSNADEVPKVLAVLAVLTSLLCVGLALYQWLGLSSLGNFVADLPPNGRPFANVGQPNHLATMLFLGLVGTWFCHEKGLVRNWIAATGGIFLQLGMVMCGSRTAWLLTATLTIALWTMRRRTALRIPRAAILAAAVSFATLFWLWPKMADALLLSPGRQLSEQADAGKRLVHWKSAIEALLDEPLLGYGWNQVSVSQSRVVIDHPGTEEVIDSSHNLLLDLMIWNGIPIGAAVFGFCLWWGWRQVATARSATSLYLLVSVTGVFVHALVEFPLQYAYFLLPVGLMAGFLDHGVWKSSRRHVGAASSVALLILASSLLGFIVVEYAKVEAGFRQLRFEMARIGTSQVQSRELPIHLLTQWREYLWFVRAEPRLEMSDSEIMSMTKLADRFPEPLLQLKLAVAQSLNGKPELAGLTLRRLCNLHSAFVCSVHLARWREIERSYYPLMSLTPLPTVRLQGSPE